MSSIPKPGIELGWEVRVLLVNVFEAKAVLMQVQLKLSTEVENRSETLMVRQKRKPKLKLVLRSNC